MFSLPVPSAGKEIELAPFCSVSFKHLITVSAQLLDLLLAFVCKILPHNIFPGPVTMYPFVFILSRLSENKKKHLYMLY